MPLLPSPHGTTNRWRIGCRCDECGEAHNVDTRDAGREQAEAAFPPAHRARVLRAVRRGATMADATAAVQITVQAAYGRCQWDPEWAQDLTDAQMDGRPDGVEHGTPTGYRHSGCRCPECRAAHHGAPEREERQ